MNYAVTRRLKAREPQDLGSTFVIEDSTANLIALSARLFSRALNSRMQNLGVSAGQWPLLLHLWEKDGLSQKELSRRVGIEEPTTANTLNRMERDGLITRAKNPNDRRESQVYLTLKGSDLREDLLPFAQEVNALASHGMSQQDKARLNSLLLYMIARLS